MAEHQLKKKQQEVLDYIKDQIKEKGYPPAVRDICQAVGLKSTSSVHAHLETLEKYGYIRRDPAKPRAIEVLDGDFHIAHREMTSIPLVGNVAAGEPILAQQNIESYFPMPVDYAPNSECFALRVQGDSMINIGINDGDVVFVQSCSSAKNGDLVVALVGDSATVKNFYKENGHYRLQPQNDSMDPIITDHCQILGQVFGVFRLYGKTRRI